MNSVYSYQIPFNNTIWKAVGIFAVLAIIAAIVPFEIHTRRVHLNNHIVFFGGLLFTVLFLLVAIVLTIKSNNSKRNPYKLELTDSTLQMPKGKAEVIKIPLLEIASAIEIGNKFNGSILQVKMKDISLKSIYIQANGFGSESDFFGFIKELNKRILNN